jgi:hypothetical protein
MFKNTRGIRQGCPLSALLFVLSVEITASRLRNNKDIKGFQIKIDEKTQSFYPVNERFIESKMLKEYLA